MSAGVPRPVERLMEAFARLPGIGPKTASRLTYHLLRTQADESLELSEALRELRSGTIFCRRCFNISAACTKSCATGEDCILNFTSDPTVLKNKELISLNCLWMD